MRDLTGPLQAAAIADLIQSLFIAEALAPSDPLWILSGWISDIPVIDNSIREFATIDPDWPTGKVSLLQAIRTIVAKGGRIGFILRDVDQNRQFIGRCSNLKRDFPGRIWWMLGEYQHEKGIVGARFDLSGSMNFTYHGIQVNGEHLIYRTDSETIAKRRLELATQWAEAFDNDL